jgi:hypothetical protein
MNATVFNKSKIFSDADKLAKATSVSFSVALKKVWNNARKAVYAARFADKVAAVCIELNNAKKVDAYLSASTKVESFKSELIKVICEANGKCVSTAQLAKNVYVAAGKTIPTFRQCYALFCQCWENNIEINY